MNNNKFNLTRYPKSNNHKITWLKNNFVNTCDLDTNCTKLTIDITKNKKIFDPVKNKSNCNIKFNINYNTILLFSIIILFIIIYSKNNYISK